MNSVKLTNVLLSGILVTLATVTAYSSPDGGVTVPSDRKTVPIVDPTAAPVVPTEDPAVAETLGSYIEYCPPNYELIGTRLCLSTLLYGAALYRNAQYYCMNSAYGGRVANAEDYYYGCQKGKVRMVLGAWLGPRTTDNRALYINWVNCADMDAEGSVTDSRQYRCALGPNWY